MESAGGFNGNNQQWEAGKEHAGPVGLRRPPIGPARAPIWNPSVHHAAIPHPATVSDRPSRPMPGAGTAWAAPGPQQPLHGLLPEVGEADRRLHPSSQAHPSPQQPSVFQFAAGGPFQQQGPSMPPHHFRSSGRPVAEGGRHGTHQTAAAAIQIHASARVDVSSGPGWAPYPGGCFAEVSLATATQQQQQALVPIRAFAGHPQHLHHHQQQMDWGPAEKSRHALIIDMLPPEQVQSRQQLQAPPQPSSRRSRSRRPGARRSLNRLFDLAATLQEQDQQQLLLEETGAQSDEGASSGTVSPRMAADAMETEEPASQAHLLALDEAPGTSRQHGMAARAPEPLLPLQHLLMSERAQQLSALEVKAIVYRVCADLASLHAAGAGGHCHVSISSISLAPSGDLATTRLLPDGAGAGACASTLLYGGDWGAEAPPAGAACCALGLGARWAGRGEQPGASGLAEAGGLGAAAYMPPEVARCASCCPTVADSPSADMWSLGVVLFVLLSGGYVPFGHRGLCQACTPNMPGPAEKVDKMQEWLEAHLYHKVSVIQQMSREQAEAHPAAQMRVIGFDFLSCDLLLCLLKADPAQRLSAQQVLSHPWLTDVVGMIAAPAGQPEAGAGAFAGPRAPTPAHPIPVGQAAKPAAHGAGAPPPAAMLRRHSSAVLGAGDSYGSGCFSPSTPTGVIDALHRGASVVSLTPTESEGSDSFMGSVSDLLLLSGAALPAEHCGAFSPLVEDPPALPDRFPPSHHHQQRQPQPEGRPSGFVAGAPEASAVPQPVQLQLCCRQAAVESYAAVVLGQLQAGEPCQRQQQLLPEGRRAPSLSGAPGGGAGSAPQPLQLLAAAVGAPLAAGHAGKRATAGEWQPAGADLRRKMRCSPFVQVE